MKAKILLCTLSGLALLASSPLQAASVSSEWNLFTSGTHAWGVNANWTTSTWASGAWNPATSTAPQNGTDNFAARIRNASANNITVETGGAVTVSRLWLERTGAGTTELKLGGNMTVTGVLTGPPTSGADSRPTGFNNAVAGTPSGLVIDLNGFTLNAGSVNDTALHTSRNYTLRDTSAAGNGTFILYASSNAVGHVTGTVNVENHVTVKTTAYTGMGFWESNTNKEGVGWNFAPTATLWLSANGNGTAVNLNGGWSVFSNMIVGSEGNATAAIYSLGHSNGSDMRITGDLTYYAGSAISMNNTSGTAVKRRIYLSGNLTDESTTGVDYGGRTDSGKDSGFFFVGGADRVQEVLVKRTGLTTRFFIGENEATKGNIRLLHGLTTTGQIDVESGSRVDVNTFTLQGGNVTLAANAKVALAFGEGIDNALVRATGRLTLGVFDLELAYNGEGWTDGDDLLLFRYTTLTGTPTLGDVNLAGFTYGDLWNDGAGNIWLRDIVAVPEPGTLAAAVLGGAVLLLGTRLRRRN